ncbi:MAG: EAL domain-containing protein [Pseudomonadota bacterium]
MVANALHHKEVMLAYQPVVLASNPSQPAFYEGLIRVLDAAGRIIPAKDFVPVIENHEMGRIIDCLALEYGLEALSANPDLRLSINMSARSVGYARWMRVLESGLEADPTVGERLILEVTESSAMLMPEVVISFMDRLQSQGIAFAMDDFGSGYTSFKFLRDFYFDIVKIDGDFIRGVHNNPDNQALVRALVGIAQQFEMFTVAEGLESPNEAAFLQNEGVDCFQGFYYGAPTIRVPTTVKEQMASA